MLRHWSPRFIVRSDAPQSPSTQIFKALTQDIQSGRLSPGDALPGSREMAAALSVNHKTIAKVYERLTSDGWVETIRRRGTFVARTIPVQDSQPAKPIASRPSPANDRVKAIPPPLLWPIEPGVSFDDGLPDQAFIPVDTLARAYSGAVRAAARKRLLSYTDPRGTTELRQTVSHMLNLARGMNTGPDNICITRGSQMGIWVVAQTFIQKGDAVVFENLSYPPAVHAFAASGARIIRLQSGDATLSTDELETICRREKVKVVYTTPHHHFPTTQMLAPDQRMRLRMLAEQFGFLIVEDDYDHEFHYDGLPMFPMASNDPNGQIIYLGSFSKVLTPSVRIGYIVASRDVGDHIARLIGLIDRQGDTIGQLAVAEFIDNGDMKRHLRRCHARYSKRRDLIVEMSKTILEDFVSVSPPSGGLACWLKFHRPPDSALHRLVRKDHAIQYLASSDCAADPREPDLGIRLGFATMDEAKSAQSIRALRLELEDLNKRNG